MMEPIRTVFILGAGASAHAGVPVMAGFLEEAEKLMQRGVGLTEDDEKAFKMVFDAVSKLQAVHHKANLRLSNIEDVFGAVEMGRLIGSFPGITKSRIAELRRSVERLIFRTIELTTVFRWHRGPPARLWPPSTYLSLAQLLQAVHWDNKSPRTRDCSVITLNYDVGLDYACHFAGLDFDYALETRKPEDDVPGKPPLPLLKLHGSLNWGWCKKCRQIDLLDVGDITGRIRPTRSTSDAVASLHLEIGTMTVSRDHKCGQGMDQSPILVPPSWAKLSYYRYLSNVWRRAANALRDAQEIYIVGFSLPETDLFFKHLFALGTLGPTNLRRLWVYDPDPDGSVEQRYQRIRGRALEDDRFQFRRMYFEKGFSTLKEALTGSPGGRPSIHVIGR